MIIFSKLNLSFNANYLKYELNELKGRKLTQVSEKQSRFYEINYQEITKNFSKKTAYALMLFSYLQLINIQIVKKNISK